MLIADSRAGSALRQGSGIGLTSMLPGLTYFHHHCGLPSSPQSSGFCMACCSFLLGTLRVGWMVEGYSESAMNPWRTSKNSVNAKFAESRLGEVQLRRIILPRTPLNTSALARRCV